MQDTTFPWFTSSVRDRLGLRNDKRLNDLVRTSRVHPPPPVVAGRRLWARHHVLQAAEALGILTEDLALALGQANAGGSQR